MKKNYLALTIAVLLFSGLLHAAVLEEVTVTAQKREQSLQDVPLSITVTTGEMIDRMNMNDVRDIANATPGLFAGGTQTSHPTFFIRGVGTDDFAQVVTSQISLYRDGVYQGTGLTHLATNMDLERVEVLKGPQGTLWGRNTTGGLINFISRKNRPGDETEGYIDLSYAEFNEFEANAAVGGNLTDSVGGRLAVKYRNSDGFIDSVAPGIVADDLHDTEEYAIRASFVIEASDKLTLAPTFTYLNSDSFTAASQTFGSIPVPGCVNPGRLGSTCPDAFGNVANPDIHNLVSETDSFEDAEAYSISLTANYDLGNWTLTSITAYSDADGASHADTDGTSVPGGGAGPVLLSSFATEYEGFSQELQFTSDYNGAFNFVLGAYYYTDEIETYWGTWLPILGFNPFIGNFSTLAREQQAEADSIAVFGEVNFQVNDRWGLIGGIRVTNDKREFEGESFFFTQPTNFNFMSESFVRNNLFLPSGSGRADNSSTEPSWRVSTVYAITENSNLWATISKGFKGADPNGGANANGSYNMADPEFLTAYEVGFKSSLLDGAMNLEGSFFYYDYEDKQVLVESPDPLLGNIQNLLNAGTLEMKGVDIHLNWAVTENFSLQGGYAYLDGQVEDLDAGVLGSFSGNESAYSPEHSFNFIANYRWQLGNGGTITTQLDGSYTDEFFFTNGASPFAFTDSYFLMGGLLRYDSPDERWYVSLWGKNITDEEYAPAGFPFIGGTVLYPGAPRQIGGTVGYNF